MKRIPTIQNVLSTRSFTQTTPKPNQPIPKPKPITPLTRRLTNLPGPPPQPSQNHHDLPTFQAHATRTALPPTAPTYIGTHYEYTVQRTLRRCGFSLHRVGGRDDAGVDLVGTWHLPAAAGAGAVRVIAQCKAVKTKVGPNLVRELEGAYRSSLAPVGWRGGGGGGGGEGDGGGGQKVGILISTREATRGVREAMARSVCPLFWMMVDRDGVLQQALWNSRVEGLGLGLLGVEVRYGGDGPGSGDDGEDKGRCIALTWDGEDIPDMDRVETRLAGVEEEWLASWGVGDWDLSDAGKLELLDLVDKSFPESESESGMGSRMGNTLSHEDRSRILQELDARLHGAAQD